MNKQLSSPFGASSLLYRIATALMILSITGVLFLFSCILGEDSIVSLNILLAWFEMCFYLCLFLFCRSEHFLSNTQYRFFPIFLFINFVNVILSIFLTLLDGHPDQAKPLLLVAILSFILYYASSIIFFHFLCKSLTSPVLKRFLLAVLYIAALISSALSVSSYFTGFYITVNAAGHLEYPHSAYGFTAEITIYGLYLLLLAFSKQRFQDKLISFSFVLFPLLYSIILIFSSQKISTALSYSIDYLPVLLAVCIIFFNVYLKGQQELLYQRMETAEKKQILAEQEKKQLELKTAIMLSQIQPHFLYNALSAIYILCRRDPEEAARTVDEFATYLRMNMSSLQSNHLVPFKEELAHTKTYLRIEKIRFGDMLHIVYDIRYDDFRIPPLTLQPLVENAVKHGAGQMENGGTITIRTRYDRNTVVVSVTDTGPGFDPSIPPEDNRPHVGIANVRSRLQSLGVGDLIIKSAPGQPTTASINLHSPINEQHPG